MDKVIKYKNIVRELAEYVASMVPSDEKVETQIIIDEQRGHYLLYSVGWENGDYREYGAFFHIDVKPDGKVYIQHDGTSLILAELMYEKGIPKSDMVLAFRAPFRRKDAPEFAES